MDLLTLIKKRRTIRKYTNKKIPKRIIDKIIEAGRWSSSLHGVQPWQFVVIMDRDVIERVVDVLCQRVQVGIAAKILLNSAASTIRNSTFLIAVYNTQEFVKFSGRFNRRYEYVARISEISAISACVQNMLLTAYSLGLGSCWLDVPLFCESKINKIVNERKELIAILTFGYPAEKGKRSKRKPIGETVRYIQ